MTPKESAIFSAFEKGKFRPLIQGLPTMDPKAYAIFEEVWLNESKPHRLDVLAVRKEDISEKRPEFNIATPSGFKPAWEVGHLDGRNYYKFESGERAWAIEVAEWCDYDHFGEIHNVRRLLPKKFPNLVIEGYGIVCKERMDWGDILGMYKDGGIQVFELTEQPTPEISENLTADYARQILREEENNLLSKPGVVGVSLGEESGRPYILVLVEKKEAEDGLPGELRGLAVRARVSGELKPQ